MRSAVELIHEIDAEYEEHFIYMVERLEDDLKDKNSVVLPLQILSLLELFL
jgi:hypothetical protein